MKKSIVTVIVVWLLGIGTANAFFGGLWDSTLDLASSAYDYGTSLFTDTTEDTKDDTVDSAISDDEDDDSFWDWFNWFDDEDEDPFALNTSSCEPAADSWCTICSYGFDLLSDLFDNLDFSCNKENYVSTPEPVQSVEGQAGAKPQLDQAGYCGCLGTQEEFPPAGAMDIIENVVDNKKTHMISEAFKEFQSIAHEMSMLALNPELVNNLSADSACLPGNFARLENALFNPPAAGGEAPCSSSFKDEIKNTFEKQTKICNEKGCKDPLIGKRPSFDDYKAQVAGLDQEKLGGKDHSSLGSWIDFMMKDEFVEKTIVRLDLDARKKPSMDRILNKGFDNIGYDFLSVVENNHADMTIQSRRTPAQTISKGLAQYLSNGMECSGDMGDGNNINIISCEELARAIGQQANFDAGEGVSDKDMINSYIATQFNELSEKAPAIQASLQTRLEALRASASPENSEKARRVEGVIAAMGVFDRIRPQQHQDSTTITGQEHARPKFDMNQILSVVKDHYSTMSAEEIENQINGTAKTVNTLKSNDLQKRCSQFVDQLANMCKMMGDGSFSASFFLGTVQRDEDGKLKGNFDNIPKLAAAVAPSVNKDGQPLTQAEKSAAVKDIESVLDQVACYESNQLTGNTQPDEYLEDYPPMISYNTEDGKGRASWSTCKACTRTYEYQGQQQQIRYCSKSFQCPLDNEDPIRDLVDARFKEVGLRVPEVRTDQDVAERVAQEVEQPGSTTTTNNNGGGLYAGVDTDSVERTYSKPMSKSKKDYYDSIVNNFGNSTPMSYEDYVAKNGGTIKPEERVNPNGTVVRESVTRSTVINDDGTVTTSRVVDPVSGQRMSSEGLEVLDNRINNNNSALVDATNKVEQIDQQISQIEANGGEVDSALKSQLDALRAQIDSLKEDNKKLAAERDAEAEKIQKARAERRVRIAERNRAANGNGGNNGDIVGNPFVPVNSATVTTSNETSNSSSGDNVSSSSGIVSGGGSVDTSSLAGNTTPVSGNSVSSSVVSSDTSVVLTATGVDGQKYQIQGGVLDLDSRSGVTSFDKAVQIALQSSKGAFVFKGKTYVKKGDEFIQVSVDKQQSTDPERKIASVEDVGDLLDETKKKYESPGEVDDTDVAPIKKVEPVTVSTDTSDNGNSADANRKVYDTESLWNYLSNGVKDLFSFPSRD